MLDLRRDIIGWSEESSGPGQIHHEGTRLNRFPDRSVASHDLKQRFLRRADSRGIRGEDVQGRTHRRACSTDMPISRPACSASDETSRRSAREVFNGAIASGRVERLGL
jgi:hypothetical protein